MTGQGPSPTRGGRSQLTIRDAIEAHLYPTPPRHGVQIAYARRRDVKDVLQHPQLDARGRWTEVDSPVGPIRAVLPVITLADRPPRMDRIPEVGERTESILSWLAQDVEQRPDDGSKMNGASIHSDSR